MNKDNNKLFKSEGLKKDIVQINESEMHNYLDKLVRKSVEETLNSFLDQEADVLCNAIRYERTPERVDSRAGHYDRKLHTKAGTVSLKIPKLRKLTFETSIIERYRRRESSVEEAMIEMYLAGVSVRRVEDITKALWDSKVSPGTVSNINKKLYKEIEEWRNLPINGKHSYVYLDGIYLKRSWAGSVKKVAVLVAVGVNEDGYREILGVSEGFKENYDSWLTFIRWLIKRGLNGVRLVVSDKCLGLVDAIHECFPKASWQRCSVHFYRNIFSATPKKKLKDVASMLKAIHAQEDEDAAKEKSLSITKKLNEMGLKKAAKMLEDGAVETFSYYHFPQEHWRFIRTNNPLERLMKEIRRRTRVVGSFPDGNSALMLVSARLRYITGKNWGQQRYINMDLLYKMDIEKDL